MKTFLVLANDTGAGKTRVTGALAGMFAAYGHTVQIVKLVETGVAEGEIGDAESAATQARETAALFGQKARVSAHTLFSFTQPLAPVVAATRDKKPFNKTLLNEALAALPDDGADFRVLETAGGLAVPIDSDGTDWSDFARELAPDATVIVLDDRLGAISQARLVAAYAKSKNIPKAGFWLNAAKETPADVRAVNRTHLLPLGLPLYADTAFGDTAPRLPAGSPLAAFFTA
jgi:dethiobiotin synthase